MKILHIGHYKENTGWSKATIDLILAMDSVGLDVTCRNVKLTNKDFEIPNRIKELEQKSLKNIDICIQQVLPHHVVGTDKFKLNVAHFVGESNTLKYNSWITNLSLMDQIWVPNQNMVENLIKDGFDEKNVKKIPYAFDLSKYTKTQPTINLTQGNDTFKFYYIADLDDRKNIESVIRCFHSEFYNNEPVSLILKVKKFGVDKNDLLNHITKTCDEVKKSLRLYKKIEDYHKEIIISEDVPHGFIDALHNSCDCFLNPTHGEGWSIPSFDAMCYGKTPICSNEGGAKEFINPEDNNTGTIINGIMNICDHSNPAFEHIFTGREEWFVPEESSIKKAMRFYYENRDKIDRNAGLKNATKFSYENIGNLIRNSINV